MVLRKCLSMFTNAMSDITEKPAVTVIIPNYNHAVYLKQRIESVLNQSYQNFELIILDDCSTDNSREVLEEWASHPKIFKIIFNQENSGSPFMQWKKGLALANGKYIWIAESDDSAALNFLEELMRPFEQDEDVLISFSRSVLIDQYSRPIAIQKWMDELDSVRWTKNYIDNTRTDLYSFFKFRNIITNASSCVFKKTDKIADLIPSDMKFCGDWLFWKKILEQKGKIAYNHLPLNEFRVHAETSRSVISMDKEIKRFKEYRMLTSNCILPLEHRYDWMIYEWSDRVYLFDNTLYKYIPLLHPSLIIRYYWFKLKKTIKNLIK